MKTLANSQILNNCVLDRGPKCSSYCYVEYTLQSRWATQRWKIKKCTHGFAVQIWVLNIYIFSRGRHVNKLSRGRHVNKLSRGRQVNKLSRGRHVNKLSRGRQVNKLSRGRQVNTLSRGRQVNKLSAKFDFIPPENCVFILLFNFLERSEVCVRRGRRGTKRRVREGGDGRGKREWGGSCLTVMFYSQNKLSKTEIHINKL